MRFGKSARRLPMAWLHLPSAKGTIFCNYSTHLRGQNVTCVKRGQALVAAMPFLVVVSLALCAWPASAVDTAKTKFVVVLYPANDDGSPGEFLVDQSIRRTFANGSVNLVQIYNEHLDVAASADAERLQSQTDYLKRKYQGRKVDLVIAGMASGLDFVLQHRAELFTDVPVVFCAVDERDLASRQLPPDVIGTPIKLDLTGTLDLALLLHPSTEHVYVIAGAAPFDVFWANEARQLFRPYEQRLQFTYLTGLPMDRLVEEVAEAPARTIISYVCVFQDGAGRTYVPAEALGLIASKANAPMYGHVDSFVGRGIVGGRVFSFQTAGEDAAKIGLRLLSGEKAARVGIQATSPNVDTFDGRQLRRWGIDEEQLPARSVVRFRESSFWELYKWHVVGVLSLCVVQALIIGGLVTQRAHRRRAERRVRQTIEAAPNGMLMVDSDGRVQLVNAKVEELFGYRRSELLGERVEILVPERLRAEHAKRRQSFFDATAARLMGAGQEVFARRKDGTEFRVEIGLSPVRTEQGLFVLASIVDVTKRIENERNLFVNQRELRVLTGKLIHSQETERRRIARELHDDLSQSLALVAMELDVLRQNPPHATAELTKRVQEIADQVRQLSSFVTGLSRQLHPSKLEQLGLVPALRSLCKELGNNHNLAIDFDPRSIPEALSQDAALCLYRVAQEAISNAIKHSGAQRVAVELDGGPERVHLTVIDDGRGFDPLLVKGKGGLGLVSMRERLNFVNGQIDIKCGVPGGTHVAVSIPIDANRAKEA